jgi:hypothetical protein
MPQMKIWPFMTRTMVEESHGVKPLLAVAAAAAPAKHQAPQRHTFIAALGRRPHESTPRPRRSLIGLWRLTQP